MVLWTLIKIVIIAVPTILCVAYLTYWERKMIGAMHVRVGPNRVAVDEGSRRPQPGQQGAVRRGPRGHADARAGRLGRRALRS
ncbi:hypothetical protein G6F23_014749 [Rhizopus arrhizus]|nr:hypothetical protein G6F23_014749 [Rhizopus arrhizus]